jgi:hypothetical protein
MTSCVSLWQEQPVIEVAYMSSRTFQGILRSWQRVLSSLQLALFDRCSGGSRFEQVLLWYVAYVWTVAKHFRCSDRSLGVTYVKKYETRGVGDGNKRQGRPMRWQNLTAIYTHCELYVEVHLNRKFRGRHFLTWLQFSIFVLWWDIRWNVKAVICL